MRSAPVISIRQNNTFIRAIPQRFFAVKQKNELPDNEYVDDPYQQILDQQVQDMGQLNERIRLYFKKGQKDYDEFDAILLQITMQVMQSGNTQLVDEIERFKEIQEQFVRRAKRKEFATIKYLIYVQYAGFLTQDRELLEGLIKYGFDELFDKLRWLDKITVLELASNIEPTLPYLSKLYDKTACNLLYNDYEAFNTSNTAQIIQFMKLFHQVGYVREDLWKKLELLLYNMYPEQQEITFQNNPDHPMLTPESLMTLLQLSAERKYGFNDLWDCIAKDVKRYLNTGELDMDDLMTILDCHYKSGAQSEEFITSIADYIEKQKANMSAISAMKPKEMLKLFRGLLANDQLNSRDHSKIFALFQEQVRARIEEFNLSMLLTVMELSRQCEGLNDFIPYLKVKYQEIYDPEEFSTEGDSETVKEKKRGRSGYRPKSVSNRSDK